MCSKRASERTGGVRNPPRFWYANRRSKGAAVHIYGDFSIQLPPYKEGEASPSENQISYASIIGKALDIAIPEPCLKSARWMRAFLDRFVPVFRESEKQKKKKPSL